eukprot:TRINITY_DN11435_c0_g1_i10.p5 TRINITY_DN11435_c0_g1~~TRINITY_DN11435_c0_g1_i10.p5  ORF type:complete len:116 (+),score=3.94 TRINITY_DN11435_c0_g1_i10:1949-2296(+)
MPLQLLIKKLSHLCSGACPSWQGDITPLGGAIHGSRMEVAKLLLEHGANVSQADLLHACTRGHPDIVQLMLSYGTNVNKPSGTRPPRIWPRPFHNYWMNVKLWEVTRIEGLTMAC